MTVCIGAIAAREKAIVMISDKAVTYGVSTAQCRPTLMLRKYYQSEDRDGTP